MKNGSLKIGFVILVLLVGTYVSVPWYKFGMNVPFSGGQYKLGLDLQGGVELDYKIDFEEARKKEGFNESSTTEELKKIIEKRVNDLGTAEPTIITSKYGNESHIIVQIPSSSFEGENLSEQERTKKNDEYIARAKETIGKLVRLEFKEQKTVFTEADKKERFEIARKIKSDIDAGGVDFKSIADKYKDSFEDIEYLSGSDDSDTIPKEVTFSGMQDVETPYVSSILETSKRNELMLGEDQKYVQVEGEKGYSLVRIKSVTKKEKERDVPTGTGQNSPTKKEKYTQTVYDYEAIFINQKPSEWVPAKTANGKVLDEKYLNRAALSMSSGVPEVELLFESEGAKIFAEITQRLIGKQLAIYVGGRRLTEPVVRTAIPNGKAVIQGRYTVTEAKQLVNGINAGIVPAPIYLTSERAIDAKIGGSSLDIIIKAGLLAFVAIMIFLIFIYRLSGILAGIALFSYVMLTLAIVKWAGVVLTLASIAGFVLSIGMAIDANILIFERSKEELKQKAEITKSLNTGFEKSWHAIWDQHLTAFISAFILWKLGVNIISGFGLMLGIGIIVSLFTAMWVSRVLVTVFALRFSSNLKAFIGLD